MANTLGYYNPAFYANEALIYLKKGLGFANTVHMGFDEERRSFGRGDVINIKRPSSFTALAAPSSAADVSTESVQISLDQWYEVKFKLSDKELAYTGERMIQDHIEPAAYALADKIDTDGCALIKQVGNFAAASSTADQNDVTECRRVLMQAQTPMSDASRLSLMVTPTIEKQLLSQAAFSQFQGSGSVGQATNITGAIGGRFGFGRIFANQNVPSHTIVATAIGGTPAVNGAVAAGATSIAIDGAAASGQLQPGDILSIGGRNYAVGGSATLTASSGAFASVPVIPAIEANIADNAGVTVTQSTAVGENVAYHRDAFALAMARLPDYSNSGLFGTSALGAQVASVQDPVTGIAMRSRIYYLGNSSEVHVALDVLYGWKLLNSRLAMRLRDAS